MLLRLLLFASLAILVASCSKSKMSVDVKKAVSAGLGITVTNIQVVNNQILITGTNLNKVSNFNIKDGSNITSLDIESKTETSLVANTLSNVTFAAGHLFDFIFSSASAASTFTVDFSLCDSTLGGKGFSCTTIPNDKEVLSYDAASGKWKPRAVNGLSYQGTWDATTSLPTTTSPGDYFIVSIAQGGYNVGDWIVFNGSSFDQIHNANTVASVFGRTGAITATKGDYSITKLADVDTTTVAPLNGDVLKFNGTNWVPGTITTTETDPTVQAFAKSAPPTCGAGQVLKSDGTSLSCVAAGSTFSGTANRVVITDGTGALAVSAISDAVFAYMSGVTSNIQDQLNAKATAASVVDWSSAGVAPVIHNSRLNFGAQDLVVVTTTGGQPTASTISTTKLGYLTDVTGNIQAQINGKISSETDPNVQAFAKSALPTCGAGQVLKADGTNFSCVTDNSGAGSYSGGNNLVVVTNGSGALSDSTISTTKLGYLTDVTGNLQAQIDAKQSTIDKTTTQAVSKLRVYGANATNYVELTAGTLTGNHSLIFPDSDGTSGQVLSTDGAGNLSWITTSGGGPANTDALTEGSTNLYFTNARVLGVPLTALSTADSSAIVATDNVLQAMGKTQAQLNSKMNSSSFVDWSSSGVAPVIHNSRLNFGAQDLVVVTTTGGQPTASTISTTKLGYLTDVTGNLQAQIDAKQSTIDKTTTQAVSKLRVYGANATNYVELSAGTLTGNHSLIFPDSDGTSGQVLSTDGAGVLSWTSVSMGSANLVGDIGGTVGANTIGAGKVTLAHLSATGTKDATTYLRGDNTWSSLQTDVQSFLLSAYTLGTNTAVSTSDTIVSALGKLQKQISDLGSVTVGGDLSGSLPNPTVAKIQGTAVSSSGPVLGNFLNFNGTNWAGKNIVTTDLKSSVSGNLFPGTGCSVNQTLQYSVGTDAFSCVNIDSLDGSKITTGTIAAARLPASASYWDAATGGINYAGGNVGIGTTAPGSALDVKGALRLSGSSSGYVGLIPAAAAGATTYTLPTTQGSAGQVLTTDGVATTPTLSWTTPTSGSSWTINTSNFTASAGGKYFVDTTSAGVTLTLPASATLGDTIAVIDVAGMFATNNLTVAANGLKVMGLSQNMTVNTSNISFELVYSNATYGWRIK